MIDFQQRISNLQFARDRATSELERNGRDLRPEVLAERRSKITADFQAGMTALANEYQAAQDALSLEVAKARHALRLAKVALPETGRASFEATSRMLPSLSAPQLAEFYADAVAAGDQGAQIAVELFQHNFGTADNARGPLMEIAVRAQSQQAERSRQQTEALQSVEGRLKALQTAYSEALTPVREERLAAQYHTQAPTRF